MTGVHRMDLAGLAALTVLGGVAYFGGVRPVAAERARAGDRDEALQREQEELLSLRERMARIGAHAERVDALIERAGAAAGSVEGLNAMLATLGRTADAAGLVLDGVFPGEMVVVDGFECVPISMELEGAYPDVARFVSELHDEQRAIEIASWEMSVSGDLGAERRGRWKVRLRWLIGWRGLDSK